MAKKEKNKNEDKLTKEEMEELEIIEATKQAKKDMFLDVAPYLIIMIFIVIIRSFIATPVTVSGSSMSPTFENKDTIILYKLTKKTRGIKRGDMVVIKENNAKIVKRVIGVPGDVISYKKIVNKEKELSYQLYVNGKAKKESYISEEIRNLTCLNNWDICISEVKLLDDEYYVLGDNRRLSRDSRIFGTVSSEEIMGTTELVIFPFSRFGIKE